ncbi:alpha/beta fold hydrolase [Cupriavidus consociatus]|uniref:alpha/beta fold hydrolase n=1 Tax=Cupriavidus consociatus TaxID=2821357 RepID=UPI001AE3FA89|nr:MULTISPECIES: alpha/beta hydrolase [unclassified Cupriavidus]MBP0622371.1 alpha/beta hydrolase [Cupriavidus sp. LEh25]MDK2659056.1 alpha/beta hydrolase [Cupriavidus sp. LEh21]
MTLTRNTLKESVTLDVDGVALKVAAISRQGELAPIVFLHGFGSTKEDFADIALIEAFAGRAFLAYDAPGCGETACSDLRRISIPFLVETAKAMLAPAGIDRFHLVGHSMGGLTGLMLAHELGNRVLSFIDIEGNVAPEDCFLSRQIVDFPSDDSQDFFNDFIDRNWHSSQYSSPLYAASLRHKVRAQAVASIFSSMVQLSDHGALMDKFLSLHCPKMFMFGEQNNHLSYLPLLDKSGVELAEISHCAHFPMYSNPVEMWQRIERFLLRAENR